MHEYFLLPLLDYFLPNKIIQNGLKTIDLRDLFLNDRTEQFLEIIDIIKMRFTDLIQIDL